MTARRTDHAAKVDGTADRSTTTRGIRPRSSNDSPAFLSITDAAAMLGVSSTTLYRAISSGQFPAVRIRDRVIIPAKAIETLTDDAIDECSSGGAKPMGGAR